MHNNEYHNFKPFQRNPQAKDSHKWQLEASSTFQTLRFSITKVPDISSHCPKAVTNGNWKQAPLSKLYDSQSQRFQTLAHIAQKLTYKKIHVIRQLNRLTFSVFASAGSSFCIYVRLGLHMMHSNRQHPHLGNLST